MAKATSDTSRQELVELALAGIDAQIRELNEKKNELMQLLGQTPTAPKRAAKAGKAAKSPKKEKEKEPEMETASAKKKRVFSAATRKKLREAAKARWAREKEPKPE
jgi:hypothetical protein